MTAAAMTNDAVLIIIALGLPISVEKATAIDADAMMNTSNTSLDLPLYLLYRQRNRREVDASDERTCDKAWIHSPNTIAYIDQGFYFRLSNVQTFLKLTGWSVFPYFERNHLPTK